ncbi:MliC family protein [Pseudoxanthomonas sp.]|uniref:MliC family protein n=1 Tax=Pseudoxanthomonas sp. TaxID=1871049 RepID=UPI002583DC21|nr:MliC family protein [Pseudoxanthomonas sp.]MCR6687531.1 MliC family protein [Pseudoxanthomonas sp.]
MGPDAPRGSARPRLPDRPAFRGGGLPAAALVLLLAACAKAGDPAAVAATGETAETGTPPPPAAATIFESHWQCGEQRIAVRFDRDAGDLTLTHDRGQLLLPRVESGSGARYADGNGNEFRDKDGAASLTLSGLPERECSRVQAGG